MFTRKFTSRFREAKERATKPIPRSRKLDGSGTADAGGGGAPIEVVPPGMVSPAYTSMSIWLPRFERVESVIREPELSSKDHVTVYEAPSVVAIA